MIFNPRSSRNRTLNDLKRIIGKVKREDAAFKLEEMICKAVCDLDETAMKWLGIHDNFVLDDPDDTGGFYNCCQILGINWKQLHSSLQSAFDIVPTSEPVYNEDYGQIHDSKESSSDNEVQRRVCAKVVPFARKRPKTY